LTQDPRLVRSMRSDIWFWVRNAKLIRLFEPSHFLEQKRNFWNFLKIRKSKDTVPRLSCRSSKDSSIKIKQLGPSDVHSLVGQQNWTPTNQTVPRKIASRPKSKINYLQILTNVCYFICRRLLYYTIKCNLLPSFWIANALSVFCFAWNGGITK
jgi:hypothetical protein